MEFAEVIRRRRMVRHYADRPLGPDVPVVDVPAHTAAFKAEFGIPDEYSPIGGICVGYRADDLPPQSPGIAGRRRSRDEVIHHGQWGRRQS
ncbi:hypothetical protein ABNF97_01000 [Plantactinospora sp. B6F1]|uniref:hypothetical protein n=1 Tax=Plantactinospora sp. B6F1 TaxID=3158971 RepID=UPI00102D17C7